MATTLRTSGITMGDSTLDVSGTAPSFTARAFVNFNGTGTPAIRASGNVSSISRNTTGSYTVNFTTAMEDADYVIAGTATPQLTLSAQGYRFLVIGNTESSDQSQLTTSIRVQVCFNTSSRTDSTIATVAFFR